jgi:putative aldouronate transport system permease protein
MPHFLSLVVIIGIFIDLTNLRDGKINQIIEFFGGQRIQFFADPAWFRPLYIITGIWQQIGWGSIIYLAAISGIDPQLYEAAIIDGANRRQQMWHITVASILPTITILFILQVGNIVTTNFQKILLMYNPGTYEVADTIGTYIFRRGILGGSLSYTTAVGLFRAVIAFLLLWLANRISKTVSEYYLW